ncbi:MAG: 4'-phosphopantetheinyl transferase superfamily protein [Planctomycetota bacterium]
MVDIDVLWLTPSRLASDTEPMVLATLDADERARAQRFATDRARLDFALGRWLLRRTLEKTTGIASAQWSFAIATHGRPVPVCPSFAVPGRLPDVNLTHGGGIVAVAASHGARVGIDAEDLGRDVPSRRLERFLAGEETRQIETLGYAERRVAFWRIWTLKEACLKASGTGIAGGLDSLAVDVSDPNAARILRWDGAPAAAVEWRVLEFRPRKTTQLAIACGVDPGEEVRVHLDEVRVP